MAAALFHNYLVLLLEVWLIQIFMKTFLVPPRYSIKYLVEMMGRSLSNMILNESNRNDDHKTF